MKKNNLIKGRYNVLERTKVDQETADFISKAALEQGCSRSQVIRQALSRYMTYETAEVLRELESVKEKADALDRRLVAMGQYEQQRFDQLLKAVKAYRKP